MASSLTTLFLLLTDLIIPTSLKTNEQQKKKLKGGHVIHKLFIITIISKLEFAGFLLLQILFYTIYAAFWKHKKTLATYHLRRISIP